MFTAQGELTACPTFPWNILHQHCPHSNVIDWFILILLPLAPVFRAGLIKGVEACIPSCGREAKHTHKVLLEVDDTEQSADGEVELTSPNSNELEFNGERAAQLHKATWDVVQSLLGIGGGEMCARAALRLWLLHLSTPLAFLVLFYAVLPMMDPVQLGFAACALFRELIYVALVMSVLYQQPTFLFFDVKANIGVGRLGLATTFILSPDLMLAGPELVTPHRWLNEAYLRPMLLILDLCAILAFLAGAISGNLFLPLAVLYSITGLSALWTSVVLMWGENEAVDSIRATLQRAGKAFATSMCKALMRTMFWLSMCAAQLMGAGLTYYICLEVNTRVHGFKLEDSHVIVQDGGLVVSILFWLIWCAYSFTIGWLCFTCCEEWPQALGDGECKLIGVLASWLLVPLVSVGWCFEVRSTAAALCFVCGLLPVALLAVCTLATVMRISSKRKPKQRAAGPAERVEV